MPRRIQQFAKELQQNLNGSLNWPQINADEADQISVHLRLSAAITLLFVAELVADAPDREHHLRVLRVLFDLGS